MADKQNSKPDTDPKSQRVDIWLCHARLLKTRTLSSKLFRAGKVRINGQKITKAKSPVVIGDVLTFTQAKNVRIAKILGFNSRRGPAPEAQALYEDLTTPKEAVEKEKVTKVAPREPGTGRPTKAERRALDKLRDVDHF